MKIYKVIYWHPNSTMRHAVVEAPNKTEAAKIALATMHPAVQMHGRLYSVKTVQS